MCTNLEEQVGGNTKTTTPNHGKKLCKNGEFSEHVLSRPAEIVDLTRKGRPFIWGKEQQDSFEKIKCRLVR